MSDIKALLDAVSREVTKRNSEDIEVIVREHPAEPLPPARPGVRRLTILDPLWACHFNEDGTVRTD